jgi:hypothetical protein
LPELGDTGPVGRLEARYAQLLGAVRLTGRPCDHCQGDECEQGDADRPAPEGLDPAQWHAIGGVDLCTCSCDGCVTALVLLRVAERDVMGPGVGVDSDPPSSDPPAAA